MRLETAVRISRVRSARSAIWLLRVTKRCVVEGVRRGVPGLASLLAADVAPFDPVRPDPRDSVSIPASPFEVLAVPDGR